MADGSTSQEDSVSTRLLGSSPEQSELSECTNESSTKTSSNGNSVIRDRSIESKRQLRAETEIKLEEAIQELKRLEEIRHKQILRLKLLKSILENKSEVSNQQGSTGADKPVEDPERTETEAPRSRSREWCSKSVDTIADTLKNSIHSAPKVDVDESSYQELDKAFGEMRMAVSSMPKTDACSAIFENYKPGDLRQLITDFGRNVREVFSDLDLPLDCVCKDDTPEFDDLRSKAAHRIKPLFQKCLVVIQVGFEHYPERCAEFLPNESDSQDADPRKQIEKIVQYMNLSKEQYDKIKSLRDEFLSRQGERLQSVSRQYWQLENQFEMQERLSSGVTASERYLNLFDASGKFVNIVAEKMQVTEIVYFMRSIGDTLSFFQKCVLFASSYPNFPDIVSIADVVQQLPM